MCAYVMSVPNTKRILHAWVSFHMVYFNYCIVGFYHGYKILLIKKTVAQILQINGDTKIKSTLE